MHSHLNDPGTKEHAANTVSQSFLPVPQKSSVTHPLPEESGSNPALHSHLYDPARLVQTELDGQIDGFSLHSLISEAAFQDRAHSSEKLYSDNEHMQSRKISSDLST